MAYAVLFLVAGCAGALWTVIPAVLKAWYEVNEIITTLMMSFIGVGVANILVKRPDQDHAVNTETRTPVSVSCCPTCPAPGSTTESSSRSPRSWSSTTG